MSYDSRAVANELLKIAKKRNISITNMQLIKLLFFAHGWYIAKFGEPLLDEEFEAWEYGPVLQTIYHQFKEYGKEPIKTLAKKFDINSGEYKTVFDFFSKEDKNFIDIIFQYYGGYDAFYLSEFTHEAGGPWDKVWNAAEGVSRTGTRISNKEIEKYFVNILDKRRPH